MLSFINHLRGNEKALYKRLKIMLCIKKDYNELLCDGLMKN